MKNIGFFYAISAAITWGAVYTLDHKILTKLSPLQFLFLNALITLIICIPLIFFDFSGMKSLFSLDKENILFIIASSALAVLANFLIFSAIQTLGASTASIFEIAYPFFVIILSMIFFKTSLNAAFFVGAIFLFIGSFIIIRFS